MIDKNISKFNSDLKAKIWIGWSIFTFLGLGIYFAFHGVYTARTINLFQEYHKSMIALSAIFFAFSPTFYALIYSSDGIREAMKNSGMKRYFDEYFKMSVVFSSLLVMISVIGLISSYIDYQDQSWKYIIGLSFSFGISSLISSMYWSYNYGRIAYNMIKFFTLK